MQTLASTPMKLRQKRRSRLPWAPAASTPVSRWIPFTSSRMTKARIRKAMKAVRKVPYSIRALWRNEPCSLVRSGEPTTSATKAG